MNLENKIWCFSHKKRSQSGEDLSLWFSKGKKTERKSSKATFPPRPFVETQPALGLLPSRALSSVQVRATFDRLLGFRFTQL
jgi:hypothetical protein